MNNSNSNSKKIRLNCDTTNRDSEMAGASASSYSPAVPTQHNMFIDESELFSNWHDRQITKCINDNAINRVLDSYLRIFQEVNTLNLQTNTSSVSVAATVSPPPVRSIRSNNRLEESAILMAISEHGLQQNVFADSNEGCSSTAPTIHEPSAIKVTSTSTTSGTSTASTEFAQIVPSTSQRIVYPTSPSTVTMKNNFNDCDLGTNEILTSNPSSIESNDDTDFMEAAVAVAIQNKGLTPYSVSMSPTR